jgi:hypothetical protein
LIPLAKSKEFAKTLIKNEARALYVVLKHWKVLSLYLVPMEVCLFAGGDQGSELKDRKRTC